MRREHIKFTLTRKFKHGWKNQEIQLPSERSDISLSHRRKAAIFLPIRLISPTEPVRRMPGIYKIKLGVFFFFCLTVFAHIFLFELGTIHDRVLKSRLNPFSTNSSHRCDGGVACDASEKEPLHFFSASYSITTCRLQLSDWQSSCFLGEEIPFFFQEIGLLFFFLFFNQRSKTANHGYSPKIREKARL